MRRASVFFCVLPLCLAGCGGDSVSGGTPTPSGVPRLPVRWPELSRDVFVGEAARSVRFEVISDLGGQVVLSGDRPAAPASARVVLSGDRPLPAGPGRLIGFTFAGAGGSGDRVGRLDIPINIVEGGEIRKGDGGVVEFVTTRRFTSVVLDAPISLTEGQTGRVSISGRDADGAVITFAPDAGRFRVLSGPGTIAADGTLTVTGTGAVEIEASLEGLVARGRVVGLPVGTILNKIAPGRTRSAHGTASRGFLLLEPDELVGFSLTTGARETSATVRDVRAMAGGGNRVYLGLQSGQVDVRNAADGSRVALAGEPSQRVMTMDARTDGSVVIVGTAEYGGVNRLAAYGPNGETIAVKSQGSFSYFDTLVLVGDYIYVGGGLSSGEVLTFPYGPEGFGNIESLRGLGGFIGLRGNGIRAVATKGVFGPERNDFAPINLSNRDGFDVDIDGTIVELTEGRDELVLTTAYGSGTVRRIPLPGSADRVFAVGAGVYVLSGSAGTYFLRTSP